MVGGMLAVLVWCRPIWAGDLACLPPRVEPARPTGRRLDVLGDHRRLFRPRRVGGRSDRLDDHPTGERRAGLAVQGFQPLFDMDDSGYSWTVGKLLRMSLVVLLVYGGLVVLTYWVFQQAPTGFIPQQDQGRLIVSVQLPDSASLQRTQEAMALVDKITLADAGRGPRGQPLGNVVSVAVQRLQFRFDVHRPGSFDERQAPGAARR